MSNVVTLKPGAGRPPTQAEVDSAVSDAAELLRDTIQSIYNGDDVDLCHLAGVEKAKSLLIFACGRDCSKALSAVAIVEIARVVITADPKAFDRSETLSRDCSIAKALEAALAWLDGDLSEPEVA